MKARRKSKSAKSKAAVRRKPAKAARPAARAEAPDPLDEFILSVAHSLNLKIDNAWMSGVRANLRVTLMLGGMVGAFAEPAPVFRA
jgi:hypothetical protein